MPPILIHINYFEQGQSLDRACKLTRELGGDGIEFRRKPPGFPGTDMEYLDEVSKALDKHPLDWVSFGGPGVDLMNPDPAHVEKEIEAAERFYSEAANRFALKIVNTFTGNLHNPDKSLPYVEYWHHGSTVATEAQWQSAIAGFQRLGTLAGKCGFRFAFETHGNYLHDTIEATMRLVDGINSEHVGALWDHANLSIFPTCPTLQEAIKQIGNKMYYVHLKNLLFSPAHFLAVSSLSAGILNIREQVRLLKESGYNGSFCIEAPRPGDREHFLREDLGYLKDLLNEAGFTDREAPRG